MVEVLSVLRDVGTALDHVRQSGHMSLRVCSRRQLSAGLGTWQ